MVIDYYTLGCIYYDFCEYNKPIDLNLYAKNIFDTCKYLIDNEDDVEDEGGGHAHMMFALCRIFEKLVDSESYYAEKYNRLFTMIPIDSMKAIIYKGRLINKDLIDKGIEPKDLFEKPRTGGVDYYQ